MFDDPVFTHLPRGYLDGNRGLEDKKEGRGYHAATLQLAALPLRFRPRALSYLQELLYLQALVLRIQVLLRVLDSKVPYRQV